MPVEENFHCRRKRVPVHIVLISDVSLYLNKIGWIRQLEGMRRGLYHKIDHTLNKYDMFYRTYLDILPLYLV